MTRPHIALTTCIWLAVTLISTSAHADERYPTRTGDGSENRLYTKSVSRNIIIERFYFTGNTVIEDRELEDITNAYVNKPLSLEALEAVRQRLTMKYVDSGYISSGAVLKDEPIDDGDLTFHIVEGTVSEIVISGNSRLRASYIRNRLEPACRPLNQIALKQRLLILRDNPNISAINAALKPASTPGASLLFVTVQETNPDAAAPLDLSLSLNNHRAPSIGAERLVLHARNTSVLGFSDELNVSYGLTEGGFGQMEYAAFDNVSASYTIPFTAGDDSIRLWYSRDDVVVFEEPFEDLDIESESEDFGIGLRLPVIRNANRELSVTLSAERRESRSSLLNLPFSFSDGAENGETEVTVLRLITDWASRDLESVLALRTSLNWGIDAWDPSDSRLSRRDGEFLSILLQGQYIRRLSQTGNQLILRSSVQWTDDALLSLEQYSVGGVSTVRGYRENQLVRDRGATVSAELRLPVDRYIPWLPYNSRKRREPLLQVAPFVDFGRATNVHSDNDTIRSIGSAGFGLLFRLNDTIRCDLYWGCPFRNVDTAEHDLQDDGIHFNIVVGNLTRLHRLFQ